MSEGKLRNARVAKDWYWFQRSDTWRGANISLPHIYTQLQQPNFIICICHIPERILLAQHVLFFLNPIDGLFGHFVLRTSLIKELY